VASRCAVCFALPLLLVGCSLDTSALGAEDSAVDGVLPWGRVENRPFFRAVMAVQGLDAFFGGAGASAELAILREESRSVLTGILREGVARGELPGLDLDAAGELLGMLLYGALMSRSHSPEAGAEPEPAPEAARRLAHLFLYGAAGFAGR